LAEGAGDKSPLGLLTRSCSAVEVLQALTARARRWALLEKASELLPEERLAGCKRRRINADKPVSVMHSPEYHAAYYGNLQSCGSVWTCPICAPKVSERRRLELDEAVNRWWADGHAVMLLTFTLQHTQAESCAAVLAAARKAHHRWWADREGRRLAESVGYVGKVVGLECTHGGHGWHVHLHVLVFVDREPGPGEFAAFEAAAAAHWVHVLDRIGRYGSKYHALKCDIGEKRVADYVAKFGSEWTLAHELAKAHVKQSSKRGATPLELLARAWAGDELAGRLWVEYAQAFKGKRQLVWSQGLRKLLGIGEEKSDSELATERQVATDTMLAGLYKPQWRAVLGSGIWAEVLDAGDGGDWRQVKALLDLAGIPGVYYPAQFEGPPGGQSEVDYGEQERPGVVASDVPKAAASATATGQAGRASCRNNGGCAQEGREVVPWAGGFSSIGGGGVTGGGSSAGGGRRSAH
jgi:hypothetical protein